MFFLPEPVAFRLFFRPTPSWLPPGRSTRSIACFKLGCKANWCIHMAVRRLRGHQKWTVAGHKAVMKSPTNKTKTKQQPKTNPPKQNKPKNPNTKQNRKNKVWQVPVHRLIHARDDSIVSSRHGMAVKTEGRTQKIARPYHRASEATKAPCGNQGSQPGSPRSHGASR